MSDANSAAPQTPPAGWYPHPADLDAELYWDGTSWTTSSRAVGSSSASTTIPPYGTPASEVSAPYASPAGVYTGPVRGDERNGIAVASLVLGIISLFLNPILVPSALAIVFGVRGRRIGTATGVRRGMATAGLVLGIVGVAGSLLLQVVSRT
ncbi:DUF4190 domain-containing protein [Microbacteriaceae bacterium VKM Ac-2855]|nr:DUF4190 domain-containing protein [Microbacteriaceae bacterium VKM Ac-2855]